MDTPYAIVLRAEVASTQDVARDLLESSATPVLVVAERQTAGRGRTGHDWQTAPRALAASLAIRVPWQPSEQTRIPLVAALAARRAVGNRTGVFPRLKWPNDLMIDTGKVGGLLVEAADDVVIIGCGLNLWWPQPPTGFAGVLATDPGSAAAAEVAPGWADEVVRALSRTAGEWDRAGYVAVCETIGQEITWAPNGAGVAVDIDATGGLVVDTPAGRTTLRSGSVRSVRDATLAADPPGEGSQT